MNASASSHSISNECHASALNGWFILPVNLGFYALAIYLFVHAASRSFTGLNTGTSVLLGIITLIVAIIVSAGFFTLQPNKSAVLVLFGAYRGTVSDSGFWFANPFNKKIIISRRARNFNSETLKVNDKRGNPIEIAAVVVWRVRDTAQAAFDVENVENYVRMQSESALRHIASTYAYDDGEPNELTLRAGSDAISVALTTELQERLAKAGVQVDEARLTHLAYAPEIAQAMLRRQQAEAVIAARQKIVHGAVSMVEMALRELSEKRVVSLDEERKAAMVSNLLVVLCGESEVHPVVNTGTLYN